jgi:hypothetical protein
MMGWGVMFCKIVGNIFDSWGLVAAKVSFFDTITYPIKAHVDDFRSDLFNCVVHDAADS